MDYYDALAALGVESAHPGGFELTKTWLNQLNMTEGQKVLEVGCGIGKTACAISRLYPVHVTAVDIRKDMIEKAREKNGACSQNVNFQVVAKHKLPFVSGEFDFVIAESVTVFNDVRKMLQEYARVLRPGGRLLDVEMAAAAPLAREVMQEFRSLYHAVEVPVISEWKQLAVQAGFNDVRIMLSGPVMTSLQTDIPAMSPAPGYKDGIAHIIAENQRVMNLYGKWLNFIILTATK